MRRDISTKSDTEIRHNKLHRKLKRAIRLNEPYQDIITELNKLDDVLAIKIKGWVSRAYETKFM